MRRALKGNSLTHPESPGTDTTGVRTKWDVPHVLFPTAKAGSGLVVGLPASHFLSIEALLDTRPGNARGHFDGTSPHHLVVYFPQPRSGFA